MVKKIKINANISREIKIETEYIKLDALLKFSALVETGGQAKQVIKDGEVEYNGEVCTMCGKKVRPGDRVRFDNIVLTVIY